MYFHAVHADPFLSLVRVPNHLWPGFESFLTILTERRSNLSSARTFIEASTLMEPPGLGSFHLATQANESGHESSYARK